MDESDLALAVFRELHETYLCDIFNAKATDLHGYKRIRVDRKRIDPFRPHGHYCILITFYKDYAEYSYRSVHTFYEYCDPEFPENMYEKIDKTMDFSKEPHAPPKISF
jgi:hypothetical protein